MKSFRFQQFEVEQDTSVFAVGTDAVLLGCLCDVSNVLSALEVGCGTGIISLMLAQRNPDMQILALDIDENAVKLGDKNFKNSVFAHRLNLILSNFKEMECDTKFDLIFSNPPYFESGILPGKHAIARQQIALNYSDLVAKTTTLLSDNGRFSCIIPYLDAQKMLEIAAENGLFLQKQINIKGQIHHEYKRVILEFGFIKRSIIIEEFVIEKSNRCYSDAYLELTKDFHCFKNN